MESGATRKMQKRLKYSVTIVVILVFSLLIANLVQISAIDYEFYNNYADSRQLRPTNIRANRGTIYDRNMSIMAQSATVWDIAISPKDIDDKEREKLVSGLSQILDVDSQKILDKSNKNNQYEIIKSKVEKDVADSVRKFITDEKLANEINIFENTKRYYPNSTLASSVIGFTGSDSQGLYGLELKYDEQLKGTDGYIVSLKNGLSENMPTNYEKKYEPIDGNSLVLSIDENIQHFLENTLSQVMQQHKPLKGTAGIVMDVNTGAILAMANMPNFDLNEPFIIYDDTIRAGIEKLTGEEQKSAKSKAQLDQWSNKSISYTYQPGSTFKAITGSAALEEKTSTLHSSFYCTGSIKVADRIMKCHQTRGHGTQNFTDAMVNSCNPAYVKIGQDLGADKFFSYFEAYGLTEKTGIDLPGEAKSSYYKAKDLGQVSLASSSFGQSMALTPIQVITAISAVVNGGNLVTPYVVSSILDENQNIVQTTSPNIKRQVISQETSEMMRSIMESVVTVKGGSNAAVKGYRIGGKSGTSQKQNPGDSEDARISSYIGIAPIDKPEIATLIMIDEPQSGQVYGSVVAAPAVATFMADVLPYLGFVPEYSEKELESMNTIVPHLLDKGVLEAISKLSAVGLSKPTVIGNGNTVIKQVPSTGSKIPKDATVILYTDNEQEKSVNIANVVGLKPLDAKRKLQKQGFNVIISGAAVEHEDSKVISQSISEGELVEIGSVIEINSVKSGTD